MKIILNIGLFCLWVISSVGQSIYDQPVKDINNQPLNLRQFEGKKLLFIILPAGDDSITSALKTFKNTYKETVQVIGILDAGIEYGDTTALRSLYDDGEPARIMLTEKMQLTGPPSALFRWLSDPHNNHSMFRIMSQPGFKFLINEKGNIWSVNPPLISLNSPFITSFLENKRSLH